MNSNIVPSQLKGSEITDACDLLILGAGFEDRAFAVLSKCSFRSGAICILITFDKTIPENRERKELFSLEIAKKFSHDNVFEVEIDPRRPGDFSINVENRLKSLPGIGKNIWIDISGLPGYAICCVLRASRFQYPGRELFIAYTAANDYFPTQREYRDLTKAQKGGVEYLPTSMAQGMSSILYIDCFNGHRSRNGATCFAIFAGYDAPRSAGAIDEINPARLLILYGKPGAENLQWRLDLSEQLHRRFELTRNTATEIVSTLNVQESLNILDQYYRYLFDDFDFTVAPVCSKMQCVATYLFWERYNEVQLIFPLPIEYSYDRRPRGVALTYRVALPSR